MPETGKQRVSENCWVEVRGFEPQGEIERYDIVEPAEADAAEFRIANNCPLARTLIGTSVGQAVEFESPRGTVELTVVDCGKFAA